MKLSFELSDRDLRFFKREMAAVRGRMSNVGESAIVAAASGIVENVREQEVPDFVRERVAKLSLLIEMLADEDMTPRARAFAAVALGIVSDKEPRPWNAKLSIGVNYRANTTTLTDGRGAGILEIL